MKNDFDPFSDRTAREIRNSLSSALIAELTQSGSETTARVAGKWLEKATGPTYRHYIGTRLALYGQIMDQVRLADIRDLAHQTVILWNAGLFFELHELLETVWHGAAGPERTALKGLIQAAGVFVHRGRGNQKAARGLASRAQRHLMQALDQLHFFANPHDLLQSLQDPFAPPPTLTPLKP